MFNLLLLLYYFLPAYVANASPPLLAKLFPRWVAPVDFALSFRGRRLLGSHKTWRGIIGATILGGITFLIQQHFFPMEMHLPWFTGFLLAFGAIVGDSVESFFKRQLHIPAGNPWFPFDQIDYTIGAFLFTFPLFWPGWSLAILLALLNLLLSASAHYIGFLLKINKEPF
jgi:CDP-2,3-bis-(O-geranylgeranyl)-sn-glycerol synthase